MKVYDGIMQGLEEAIDYNEGKKGKNKYNNNYPCSGF